MEAILIEVLLLTLAHSNQCAGIFRKDLSGQRKEGESMVKKQELTHSSRGTGDAVQWSEEGVSALNLSCISSLTP